MRTHRFLLIFGIYIVIAVSRLHACEYGWHFSEGSCFKLSTTTKGWNNAQDDCSGKGGRLAEPKTFSVLEFLRNKCRLETVNEGFWIGGTDMFNEGTWVWSSTKEDITVLDWNFGEPNNHLHGSQREHCLFMNKVNNEYKMNDRVCSNQYNYICEVSQDSTTAVASTELELITTTTYQPTTQLEETTTTAYPSTTLSKYGTSTRFHTTRNDPVSSTASTEYTTTTFPHTTHLISTTTVGSRTHFTSTGSIMSNHIIASEGDTISLPCPLVSSIMGDDIFWKRFLNAEELPLPSISSGGNMKLPYLMLTAVRWFDLGIYECHVISEGKAMVHFINLTVITSENFCPCACDYRQKLIYWTSQGTSNKTYAELLIELKPVLAEIEDNLRLNITKLSSYKRRKTSAEDDRVSSKRIGYFGAVILGIVLGLLMVIDTSRFFQFIKRIFQKNYATH